MAAKKKTPAKKKPALKKKPSPAAGKKTSKKPAAPKRAASSSAKKSTGKKAARPTLKSKRPATRRKAPAKKAVKTSKAAKSTIPEAPLALELARTIAAVAAEKKAENVLIIDTRARSSSVGYDYVVLASGESDRQLSAIHEGVDALLKPQGKRASSVEASPDWVCVNYDEGVVAHFFTPDRRDQMDLEDMWKDAPRVSL
jgi:ribosome-associated protein